ncbi:hypothetical protein BaRGS_00040148 [Batillaria attramentaria]|uniref:Immunoglobulin V-set domain-containing protein n=1 Tax=Batillaria attramentaria TaxID=370345 RepID=A0ABD0J197_9CAEN
MTPAGVTGYLTQCKLVEEGNSGKLTCEFSIDLEEQKYDFTVQRYDLIDDVTPDKVLGCIFRKDSEEPDCTVADGYKFNKNTISNVIILEIPHLEKKHEGWYICQVIPPLDEKNKTVPCNYQHTETRDAKENDSTHVSLTTAVLVVVGLILVVLVVTGIICRRKIREKVREMCCNSPRGDQNEHEPMA